jgi:hypothetical protein
MFEKWLIDNKSNLIHVLNVSRLMANEISNKIKGRESLHHFYQIVKSSEDLLEAFVEFFDDQSPTFKFCSS